MQFPFMVCGRFSLKFRIHGAVRFPSRAVWGCERVVVCFSFANVSSDHVFECFRRFVGVSSVHGVWVIFSGILDSGVHMVQLDFPLVQGMWG